MDPIEVGVDIAKASFTAAVWQRGQAHALGTFANSPDGFAALAQAVAAPSEPPAPVHLPVEPTGGYELALAHWAHGQGWRVSCPNPRQVREWAAGLGRRAKTDRQDAQVLARYGAERQPPAWQPWATAWSELDSLLRRKEELSALLRQERNRPQALALRPGIAGAVPASIGRLIEALEGELREIEQAIAAHQQQGAVTEALARLRTVPGVGARTALPLLVLLQRWEQLTAGRGDAKGLVAYVGLDPQPYESGTSVWRRATSSRQGDRAMRARLYMAALGGLRGRNPLRSFYDRLVGRRKAKKLALVAAARKLLVWAWAVYRQQQPFDAARFAAPA
jgi:transposase